MSARACMVCDGKGSRYVEGTGPMRCDWCAGTGTRLLDPESEYGKLMAKTRENAHRIWDSRLRSAMDRMQVDDVIDRFWSPRRNGRWES